MQKNKGKITNCFGTWCHKNINQSPIANKLVYHAVVYLSKIQFNSSFIHNEFLTNNYYISCQNS